MTHRNPSSPGASRFLPNTVALVLQTIGATVITLAQVKLLALHLTPALFGLFAALRGFSLLISTVATNGLPSLLVRFIPQHEARGNYRRALRLTAVSVTVAVAIFGICVVVLQSINRMSFGFVGAGLLTDELLFWFYGTTLGVALKLVLYGGLNGLRRLKLQVWIELTSLAAVLWWIFLDRHTLSITLLFRILAIVNFVTAALGFIALFWLLGRRLETAASGDASGGRLKSDRGYAKYLFWAIGISFVAVAFSDVDRYLLSQMLTLEVLSFFHIGSRITRLANRLLAVPALAFQPEVTRLDAEGRMRRAEESTTVFIKFNTALAVLITFAIVAFAGEIVVLISSERYLAAVPLLVLLALSLPLTTMTAPITTVMKALDQVRDALWCDLGWAVTYVGLLFILSPPLQLLGPGAAHLAACTAQLMIAVRLSNLRIGGRELSRLIARLGVCGTAAFVPIVLVNFLSGPEAPPVVAALKGGLFVGGIFIYQRLVRALHVFSAEEMESLCGLVGTGKLGAVFRTFAGRVTR